MICAGGEEVRVGRLTMDTSHAAMDLTADGASRHYDETGSIIGFCNAGHDEYGIWVAGSLRPDIDPADVIIARGSPLSGDWRSVDGHLELVGALAVVVNGFEIPEPLAQVASGQPMSLVAAGMFITDPQETPMPDTADTPDAMVAASPFAKGEPAPPDGDDAPGGFDAGDTVTIGDTDMVGQVVTSADDGSIVVELTVPAELLELADDEDAMAASARFTGRMADRKRDADISKLTTALSTVTAALSQAQETSAARDAKLDELLTKQRNAEFDSITAGLD